MVTTRSQANPKKPKQSAEEPKANAQKSEAKGNHSDTTIKSLPLEVVIMIMERLKFTASLNLAKALQIPQQVAVQYFDYDEYIINYILYRKNDLKPSSYKALLKNKSFLIEANPFQKAAAAVRTFDLDFLKNYLEEFKPDSNQVFYYATIHGFTDAVKLLLQDTRFDPSARDNQALIDAAFNGHLEIVKLLLQDTRVNPAALDNVALFMADEMGHMEIVKLLIQDSRVHSKDNYNHSLFCGCRKENK